MKGLFLYNPLDLNSKIAGGVQICSKEFVEIIKETIDELYFFEVNFSRSLSFRIRFRFNLDIYQSYQPQQYKNKLIHFLNEKQITHVFINKAELIKFSKLIKTAKLIILPKIIIMSHGNESGDLLAELTNKKPKFKGIYQFFGILKLGGVLFIESWYRKRYIDLVCTMTVEESAIEKWLGINEPFIINRLINQKSKIIRNPLQNVFGYVGTLSHSPNIDALEKLCEKIKKSKFSLELRVVGQPKETGEALRIKYPFIKYLGPLNDNDLIQEIKQWGFFINPIFNYSRGASMKLAKAIEWEIPIITTIAGRRGYLIADKEFIETKNNPVDMANAIKDMSNISKDDYQKLVENMIYIRKNSINAKKISELLKIRLNNLSN